VSGALDLHQFCLIGSVNHLGGEEIVMTNDLVSLVMRFLTPDVIARIAAALGLDRNKAETAIAAAVPGVLAAFSGVAAQPGGAQKLADAAKQQTGKLGDLAGTLGTGGQNSLIDKGSQMLSSLLGPNNKDAISGAVAKFSGVGQGGANSLIGMLAPAVMGIIAKQQGPRGLDASGVASLLAGEKDNIAAALPAGFSRLLDGTGLLDSLGGAAKAATSTASQTVQAAASTTRGLADSAQRASRTTPSSSSNWLYWLIPLLLVAAALFYFFSRPTEQAVEKAATTAQTLTVGGVDIGKQVDDSVASLRTALGSVTDAASAQASLPKVQEATSQIDKIGGLLGQLSPDQRKLLAGLINQAMPALNPLFDKVLAIPGVAEILKPAIDTLKAKLALLTT
jgi:hypothetical protein